MPDDPLAELLEEYWAALRHASSQAESQRLRDEIQERLESVASSLDLLNELHSASNFVHDTSQDKGHEDLAPPPI